MINKDTSKFLRLICFSVWFVILTWRGALKQNPCGPILAEGGCFFILSFSRGNLEQPGFGASSLTGFCHLNSEKLSLLHCMVEVWCLARGSLQAKEIPSLPPVKFSSAFFPERSHEVTVFFPLLECFKVKLTSCQN